MEKKDNTVTVRLTKEVAEKFKSYAQNKNESQGEFLGRLIAEYEKGNVSCKDDGNLNLNQEQEFTIFLTYANGFLKDEKKRFREPKKFNFNGKRVYWYILPRPMFFEADYYRDQLKNEFGIDEELNNFEFSYWVGVAEDCTKKRFVVVEEFIVKLKNANVNLLSVNRCKFADGLSEIIQHIEKFAKPGDIMGIQRCFAEIVTEDKDIESFLL